MSTVLDEVKCPFDIYAFGVATEDYLKEAPASGVQSGDWVVEGFAATSDLDGHGDIITPEALKGAIQSVKDRTTVLFNHDMDQPIGRVVQVKALDTGLWLKMVLSKTQPDKWTMVQEGVLNKFSVRIGVPEGGATEEMRRGKPILILSKILIKEISLVTVPANPKARTLQWYIQKALDSRKDGGEKSMDKKLEQFKSVLDKAIALEGLDDETKTGLQSMKAWLESDEFGKDDTNLKEALEASVLGMGKSLGGVLDGVKTDMVKDLTEVKGMITKMDGLDAKVVEIQKSIGSLPKMLEDLKTLVESVVPNRRGQKTIPKKDDENQDVNPDDAIELIEKSDEFQKKVPTGDRIKAAMVLTLLKDSEDWLKMDENGRLAAFFRAFRK